ncbi:MAG: helix-turn-helix transcriptional regulator [Thiomonas sp.]
MKKSTLRRVPDAPVRPPEFDAGKLHDDVLIGSSKTARFLGLPDSTFFLLRKRMGRDFPRPVITCGRPRWRVGALREWMRRMESSNGGDAA